MKIILAPSKTQKINLLEESFLDKKRMERVKDMCQEGQNKITKGLVQALQQCPKDKISSKMKIKGKLLDSVVDDYMNFEERKEGTAIASYTGTVFKELQIQTYKEKEFDYIENHLMILSALYGPISGLYPIKAYRLDMTMSLFEISLYKQWEEVAKHHFLEEDIIIDLASMEFSKLVPGNKISIEFVQSIEGVNQRIAYHSKQGRGYMLNYLIKNQIENLEELKMFNEYGYVYSKELSTDSEIVFMRSFQLLKKARQK